MTNYKIFGNRSDVLFSGSLVVF